MSDAPAKPKRRRPTSKRAKPPSAESPSGRTESAGGDGARPASKRPRKKGKPAAGRKPGKRARRKPVARTRGSWTWAAFALGIAATIVVLSVTGFVLLPGPGAGKSVEIEWSKPESAGQAADLLAGAGLVRSSLLMSLYLRFEGNWQRIEPGPHLVQDDMSPRTLLRRLRRLRGGAQVRVPIPEGFNKFEIANRMHERGVCSARAFLAAASDPTLLGELRLPAPDAEGYLFPATYELTRNHAPRAVVRKMVNESTTRHARVFDDHADAVARLEADLGWTRHGLLTLASVVEKEAAVDEERPIIASVFLNRMYSKTFRPRQRLQSDPTARYGCLLQPEATPTCEGAEHGVTGPMVRDPLNPYSTYAHPGLPPGPICNPGEASLRAVLAPAETDYLYFVAKGGGRHQFSESYDDHRDAIRRGKRGEDGH